MGGDLELKGQVSEKVLLGVAFGVKAVPLGIELEKIFLGGQHVGAVGGKVVQKGADLPAEGLLYRPAELLSYLVGRGDVFDGVVVGLQMADDQGEFEFVADPGQPVFIEVAGLGLGGGGLKFHPPDLLPVGLQVGQLEGADPDGLGQVVEGPDLFPLQKKRKGLLAEDGCPVGLEHVLTSEAEAP